MRLLLPFPSPSQTEIHQATSHFIVQTSERKDFPPWKPRRLLTTDPHSLTHKMSKQSAENKCFSRKPDPQMIPDNRVRLIRKGNLGKGRCDTGLRSDLEIGRTGKTARPFLIPHDGIW
jgi:hypothetical protein